MPKISALPEKNYSSGDDYTVIVDDETGDSKKIKVTHIMPVGSVTDFAGTVAPAGWILCYGQTLDASVNTEYQALYDVIGNTYGGTDNTDFVVPDLRGRVVAGRDDMGGVSADRLTDQTDGLDGDTLGDTGGAETQIYPLGDNGWAQLGYGAGSPNQLFARYKTSGVSYTENIVTTSVANAGGSATRGRGVYLDGETDSGNNVQPTIILNKIMKY